MDRVLVQTQQADIDVFDGLLVQTQKAKVENMYRNLDRNFPTTWKLIHIATLNHAVFKESRHQYSHQNLDERILKVHNQTVHKAIFVSPVQTMPSFLKSLIFLKQRETRVFSVSYCFTSSISKSRVQGEVVRQGVINREGMTVTRARRVWARRGDSGQVLTASSPCIQGTTVFVFGPIPSSVSLFIIFTQNNTGCLQ